MRRALETAFRAGGERFGLRLVHYCILGNHLHLLVEVENNDSLSRGMQGLAVRSAKAINRALGRSGRVFADRFHARSLETRREVANALRYVLHNAQRQGETAARDPYSSERWIWRTPDETAPVRAPRTWLLRVGWLPGLERRARD